MAQNRLSGDFAPERIKREMPPTYDMRARKRAELGLSPQRPTAKRQVLRPPDSRARSWTLYLLPVGLVAVMGITLFLMLGAGSRLAGIEIQSDWSWARLTPPESPLERPQFILAPHAARNQSAPTPAAGGVQSSFAGNIPASTAGNVTGGNVTGGNVTGGNFTGGDVDTPAVAPRLLVADNFSQSPSIFAQQAVAGRWRTEHIARQAIYRMEVWPGHVAWSLLDLPAMSAPDAQGAGLTGFNIAGDNVAGNGIAAHRMQTATAIAAHTPWAYAGLAARVDAGRQLILFIVDGRGRYSIQLLRAGVPEVAVPWTPVDVLNPAGTGNVLMLEDDGATVRFFGNQYPLYQLNVAEWEPGQIGIAAGALREGVGEARFEWFQLYAMMAER